MASWSSKPVLREIGTLFTTGTCVGLSDSELIEHFLNGRGPAGEAAFAALVARHGPMVLGVCRRVLGDQHDAEDAFQATFLVLVRRAAAIARRELLGPWLHGVAIRTAAEARTRAARRRAKESQVTDAPRAKHEDTSTAELRSLLDEELSRLPEKYRRPLILCELEGLARREASRRLGVPEGTISSRLARGRALLRERLVRRGLAISAGTLAAALEREVSAVAVSEALTESTVKAAARFAAGSAAAAVSGTVATLTEGVLKTMFLSKLRLFAVTSIVGLFVTSAVVVGQHDISSGSSSGAGSQEPASTARQLRALESKLDRILETLGGPDAAPRREPAGDELRLRYPASPPKKAQEVLRPGPYTVMAPRTEEPTDPRIRALERRVDRVEQRLDEMARVLDRLSAQGPVSSNGVGKPGEPAPRYPYGAATK